VTKRTRNWSSVTKRTFTGVSLEPAAPRVKSLGPRPARRAAPDLLEWHGVLSGCGN